MKVKELIEYLKDCNPDSIVKISAPFHNGYENSPVIDKLIDIEYERLSEYTGLVEIEIADYQI